MQIRRKLIRQQVERILEAQECAGPPVLVEQVARRLGLKVQKEPAPDDLSGFLLRRPGDARAVIGVNSEHHPNRQRFSIAHEIGHFLLHEGEVLHVDRKNDALRVKLRGRRAAMGDDPEEIEANLFAAELLMPERFLERDLERVREVDLYDEDSLSKLARSYKVSTQALVFRLANLGWIDL